MIKRILVTLTICLIITGLISPVFSSASALPQPNWTDPGISEIINISDLTGWMLNGGTFDVSQYTNAESFMNDYFNARTKTRLVSPGEDTEDYYEVFPGFGINNQLVPGESFSRPLDTNRVIASSFRDHSGYGRRLSNEVNDALLSSGSLYDTKIPLLNEIEFANFVGYNHDALKLYSEFFNSEDVTPNPDPAYQGYITTINDRTPQATSYGTSFFWGNTLSSPSSNRVFYNNGVQIDSSAGFANNYSWIVFNQNGQISTYSNNSYNTIPILGCNIFDIYIDNNNGVYNLTTSTINQSLSANWAHFGYKNAFTISKQDSGDAYFNGTNTYTLNWTPSFSGTLQECFDYISRKVKNVNIYVDGVPWSIVGTVTTPTITPEFPDAVGGEELNTTTWPISRPRAPYYTSVPGMLRAIEDAIQDDGKLDIDDLKPYLTDENGDPVPDPIFDPEPVPIPVPDPVNPDVVPGLPELPVIPLNMPGYNGVSVLAEIINFTNQSLPNALIVTFWGVVFGIVILGLIKILHK